MSRYHTPQRHSSFDAIPLTEHGRSLIQCFATLIGAQDNTILRDLMIPEHAHDWDAESKPDFGHTLL